MIELAMNGKRGLELGGPLMLAAGGYGSELGSALAHAHALVTLPTSLRPRMPGRNEIRLAEFPGGLLWDREGANPGLAAVLRSQRHFWRTLTIPLILALASEDARHWGEIARRVGRIEAIGGLELELAEEVDPFEAVTSVRAETDLPILAQIPLSRPAETAEAALEGGADALVVGLAPRGVESSEQLWEGRLAGPACKPLALSAVYTIVERFPETPVIGAGGVHTAVDVRAFLDVGARAVQIDTALWRNPNVVADLALELGLAPRPGGAD